jgi:hypothetical protein
MSDDFQCLKTFVISSKTELPVKIHYKCYVQEHNINLSALKLTDLQILRQDSFLVNLNDGTKQMGVFVMLLIGNVCMLIILRYVGTWVGAEVQTNRRGCSMAEWFLFIFVLDIKIYFIFQTVRQQCVKLYTDRLVIIS